MLIFLALKKIHTECFIFLGTHLSNQNYDVCVRRKEGFCSLCWIPEVVGVPDADPDMAGNQPTRGAFGLR